MTVNVNQAPAPQPSDTPVRAACSSSKDEKQPTSMTVRNPAPDASPPRITPGIYGTFTISR